jgi:superfamily II DNA/RNA helicase
MNLFSEFGLLQSLIVTLKEKKIFKPTEIQSLAIPLMMSGQSVVGISETGSGKTLTYALPLLHHLKQLEIEGSPVNEPSRPRALVMLPTRDLGEQVTKVFKAMTHETRLRARAALGGMDLAQAKRNIAGTFEILLATPGRLVQLLDLELIDLSDVRYLIFDEADQMLDQGFLSDSQKIFEACPNDTLLSLFTATLTENVQELITSLFANAEVVQTKGSGKVVKTLSTSNRNVKDGKRWPLFESILAIKVEGGTLVFTNTRQQCDKLAKELTDKGYSCAIYRGEMEKQERRQNLKKFRDGKIDLLISTDLASRGLDLEYVGRVINYHLPQQMENYLHRVGRTARAGRAGLVINLVTERDARLITKIEALRFK